MAQDVKNTVQLEKDKAKKRRRWLVAFVAVNALLLCLALAIRGASPQIVIAPMSYFKPLPPSKDEIRRKVDARLMEIIRNRRNPDEFKICMNAFNSEFKGLTRHVPSLNANAGDHEFDKDFYLHKECIEVILEEWRAKKKGVITQEYRNNTVNKLIMQHDDYFYVPDDGRPTKPREVSRLYFNLERISMGLTEGMLAPLFLTWRAYKSFLRPKRTMLPKPKGVEEQGPWASVFTPKDKRRKGAAFTLAAFYGTIVCGFLIVALSQRKKMGFLAVFAILYLAYGTFCLYSYCSEYDETINSWTNRQSSSFFSLFDFLWPKSK